MTLAEILKLEANVLNNTHKIIVSIKIITI